MSCPRGLETATLFAAGELGFVGRARFAAHLRGCGECAAAVREMREARAVLEGLTPPAFSAGRRAVLAAAARQQLSEAASRQPLAPRWRLATLAATLAAAVAAGLWIRPAPPAPVASWPGPPGLQTEPAPEPALLAWDPPGDLDRIAGRIRSLRRSAPPSPIGFSARDRGLRQLRERLEHLETESL